MQVLTVKEFPNQVKTQSLQKHANIETVQVKNDIKQDVTTAAKDRLIFLGKNEALTFRSPGHSEQTRDSRT